MSQIKFEDKIDVINRELRKRRGRWQLKARADFDFEDVEQIIRFHIFRKWDLWDQKYPLEPWVNRIISNQINNLLRNLYSGVSRPCLKCAANQGGDLCAIYQTQCSSCQLYSKWFKRKKSAYDIKIPLSLENHSKEISEFSSDFIDYERSIKDVHERMSKKLSKIQWKVYEMLYINNMPESEVATKMGYKKNDDIKRRSIRYKQLENYKKKFILIAKKIMLERDI